MFLEFCAKASRPLFVITLLSFTILSQPVPVFAQEETDKTEESTPDTPENTYELLNLFGDVYERVKRDYVEEVSDSKLVEAALNGMLTSLDPHSGYLNEKSFKEMQVQTKGEFGGLGIEVTMDNGLVKVITPIDDTPAFKAGVKAGDYISEIDKEAVLGLTLNEAVEKMRGPVGTKIDVTILREGLTEPLKVSIVRDIIKIKSIKFRKEDDVGYVRISSFSEQTYVGLENAVNSLKKDIPNMKGLVLDLRNNPGGLLDQAIAVSDAFLDYGEIVSTRERDPNNTKRFAAQKGDLLNGLPIVVLINNGSASASEIVAGALKDHKRAVILGVKSFGKGSVQTVIPLPGHGAMRLTTSRYFTPSGHSIQAKGIEPDIVVEPATIKPIEAGDLRSEAELRGALANPEGKMEEKKPLPNFPQKPTTPEEESLRGVKASEDFQLARALDLIRALNVYSKAKE